MANFVVIGSGLAGYGVVRELRRLAPAATITVVTRDDGHFYSKPALSTALAKGKAPHSLVTLPAEKMVATHRLALQARATAEAIDRATRMVRLSDRSLDYDRLILATGAVPVRPMLDGDAAGEIMSVNSLDHYATFRARLVPGMRVAIIGAGLVGCEFANDLSQHGHPVTVIDPLPTPLGQLVPRAIGTAMRDALAAQNVSWQLGNCVTAIDRNGMALSLLLSDGTTMPADIVLSAIGLRPAMALAHDAGLTVERGILVDDHGRTSDHDIFAIGDCAQYPHGLSAFITPIMAAARAIAATVTGTPTAMRFPALSVQVKTSACPLVLLAPPTGTDGTWVSAQRDAAGEKHLFLTATGQVTGYAMTGRFCDQRMDLDRAIMSEEGLRDVA